MPNRRSLPRRTVRHGRRATPRRLRRRRSRTRRRRVDSRRATEPEAERLPGDAHPQVRRDDDREGADAGRLRRAHRPGRPAGASASCRSAVTDWFGDGSPGFIFPWATAALEAADGELPDGAWPQPTGSTIEKVASFAPDLIIGPTPASPTRSTSSSSKIAPTVAQSGDYTDYGTPWDEVALTIGTAVGKADEMHGDRRRREGADRRRGRGQPRVRGQERRWSSRRTRASSSTAPRTRARGCSSTWASTFPDGVFGESDAASSASRSSSEQHLRPRPGRRRRLARPRRRQGRSKDDLRRHHDRRRGPLVRHQRGQRRLLRRAQLRDAAEHPRTSLERYVPQLAAAVDGDPATVPPEVAA